VFRKFISNNIIYVSGSLFWKFYSKATLFGLYFLHFENSIPIHVLKILFQKSTFGNFATRISFWKSYSRKLLKYESESQFWERWSSHFKNIEEVQTVKGWVWLVSITPTLGPNPIVKMFWILEENSKLSLEFFCLLQICQTYQLLPHLHYLSLSGESYYENWTTTQQL